MEGVVGKELNVHCRCEKKKFYNLVVLEQNYKLSFILPSAWIFQDERKKYRTFFPKNVSVEEATDWVLRHEEPKSNDLRWGTYKVCLVGLKSANYRKLMLLQADINRFFVPKESNAGKKEKESENLEQIQLATNSEMKKFEKEDENFDKFTYGLSEMERKEEPLRKEDTFKENASVSGEKTIKTDRNSTRKKSFCQIADDLGQDSVKSAVKSFGREGNESSSNTRYSFSPRSQVIMAEAAERKLTVAEIMDQYNDRPSIMKAGEKRLRKKLKNETAKLKKKRKNSARKRLDFGNN